MRLEVLDPSTLTLDYAIRNQYSLYYITRNPDNGIKPYEFKALAKEGLELPKAEYILCCITHDDEDNEPEAIPPVDKKRDKPVKSYERLTYRCNTSDETKNIFVDCRPDGSIRVNFKDKDSAKVYQEYIREMFYSRVSGDYLVLNTIFHELRQVNKNDEEKEAREASKTWGYPTQDFGEIKYISEVAKTRDANFFGFTLKRPQKLYGVKAETVS